MSGKKLFLSVSGKLSVCVRETFLSVSEKNLGPGPKAILFFCSQDDLEKTRDEDRERAEQAHDHQALRTVEEVDELAVGHTGQELEHQVGHRVVDPVDDDARHHAARAIVEPTEQEAHDEAVEALRPVHVDHAEEQGRKGNGQPGGPGAARTLPGGAGSRGRNGGARRRGGNVASALPSAHAHHREQRAQEAAAKHKLLGHGRQDAQGHIALGSRMTLSKRAWWESAICICSCS